MKSMVPWITAATILFLMTYSGISQAAELQQVKPEKVGVSSQRLQKIDLLAKRYVENDSYSGVVTLIARNGKIIHSNAEGSYGIDSDKPMAADTLFRIYSMTKPITAVAAMMLYEEGKFHMGDPVSKFLRAFKDQKLLKDGELVAPKSPMTMRQLLTHTAGLTYGWTTDNAVDIQYQQDKPLASKNLQEFVSKLAKIPLRFEPGTRYHYSVAYDVLGAVIEQLAGTSLDKFFHDRIFLPLNMQDTFFQVPADKMHRLASDQTWDYEKNQIAVVPKEHSRNFEKVSLFMGGGGLVSTAGDYLRFCQMVLNGGALDGQRLLGPKTAAFMGANHLSPKVWAEGRGEYPALDFYPGQSMGLGYGVVTNPDAMPDLSSKGELSWGGVAGTKFWIDPVEQLIGIALVQLYQSPWPLRSDLKSATYPALVELY